MCLLPNEMLIGGAWVSTFKYHEIEVVFSSTHPLNRAMLYFSD